ncbi:MAG: SGNH/GDSL hydrolase family protein [Lentisphaeraceae bacterium]|nr:SGNH/GDSL hydrolase family protein [Lentisphaeraceae bacterium]
MKLLLVINLFFSTLAVALDVQFIKNLDSGKAQKIVVYGTSLTAKGPWVSALNNKLKDKYAEKITLINSGGSGMDSNWGLANLQKKVIDHKPNAVFIEFGMNDAVVRFKNSKDKIRTNISSIILKIKTSLPDCEIILMTMNPALGIPNGHRSSRAELNAYYEIYRELAKKNGLKIIDHFQNWQTFLDKAGVAYKKYIPDGIHPNKAGCEKVIIPEMVKVLGL